MAEAGSSPTCTTASPGCRPNLPASSAARAATSPRTFSATALPSRRIVVPLTTLDIRIGERGLAPVHVVEQRLVGPGIERRRLVLRELLLPQAVGALRHVRLALR